MKIKFLRIVWFVGGLFALVMGQDICMAMHGDDFESHERNALRHISRSPSFCCARLCLYGIGAFAYEDRTRLKTLSKPYSLSPCEKACGKGMVVAEVLNSAAGWTGLLQQPLMSCYAWWSGVDPFSGELTWPLFGCPNRNSGTGSLGDAVWGWILANTEWRLINYARCVEGDELQWVSSACGRAGVGLCICQTMSSACSACSSCCVDHITPADNNHSQRERYGLVRRDWDRKTRCSFSTVLPFNMCLLGIGERQILSYLKGARDKDTADAIATRLSLASEGRTPEALRMTPDKPVWRRRQ